jgi:hypothetical protein
MFTSLQTYTHVNAEPVPARPRKTDAFPPGFSEVLETPRIRLVGRLEPAEFDRRNATMGGVIRR